MTATTAPVEGPVFAPAAPVERSVSPQRRVEPGAAASAARLQASREKAARDKAEREARVKVTIEQRELAAARRNADQDAARQRSEEARLRVQPSPEPTAPVLATGGPRTRMVKEICAGRNLISQAICESRECGSAEHRSEALCKSILAKEERRRELGN